MIDKKTIWGFGAKFWAAFALAVWVIFLPTAAFAAAPGQALDAPGIIVSLSTLSIMMVIIAVYFAIFWMMLLIAFWPVTVVYKAINRLLNPPFYD